MNNTLLSRPDEDSTIAVLSTDEGTEALDLSQVVNIGIRYFSRPGTKAYCNISWIFAMTKVTRSINVSYEQYDKATIIIAYIKLLE